MFNAQRKPRTWGFRFFLTDALAIFVFVSIAWVLWCEGSPLGWMLMITAAHFFLFCNVFRIVRRRELIWAGLFLLNMGLWAWFAKLACLPVLLCQLPVTVVVIVGDLRSPGYHGIFANQLNPRLNDYLAHQERPHP